MRSASSGGGTCLTSTHSDLMEMGWDDGGTNVDEEHGARLGRRKPDGWRCGVGADGQIATSDIALIVDDVQLPAPVPSRTLGRTGSLAAIESSASKTRMSTQYDGFEPPVGDCRWAFDVHSGLGALRSDGRRERNRTGTQTEDDIKTHRRHPGPRGGEAELRRHHLCEGRLGPEAARGLRRLRCLRRGIRGSISGTTSTATPHWRTFSQHSAASSGTGPGGVGTAVAPDVRHLHAQHRSGNRRRNSRTSRRWPASRCCRTPRTLRPAAWSCGRTACGSGCTTSMRGHAGPNRFRGDGPVRGCGSGPRAGGEGPAGPAAGE